MHHLVVLLHLTWQLLQHLSCQLYAVVTEFPELDELYQVTGGLVTSAVSEFTAIVIKLVHNIEGTIANTNNDDADREATALNDLIDNLLLVMDFTVGKDEDDHVMIFKFL